MIDTLYDAYKPWSDGGSIFLIADTHFDDADCKLMDTNWITPREQIDIIKKCAHKNDTLIHLGDVGNPEYMNELRCHKVLLLGNHDTGKSNFAPYFDEIFEGPLFIAEKILLSHEPVMGLPWCVNIHGHDHSGKFAHDKYHLNLSANLCNYTPVNLKKLIKAGLVSKIPTIHRICVNNAIDRKNARR